MWLAAWKLVSNDAKRTVAPPNAKHSTLPQGCFLCFLFLITFTIRQQYIIYLQQRNQRDGSFGMPLAYTNQKLLCLQRKCGLGLEMALSVDARRGSAPCRWAFPGVLFIIKKMLERNFGNFEKKIILTTKTIPTMQRNKKTFK